MSSYEICQLLCRYTCKLCGYASASCSGVWVELVSFGIHKRWNHKTGDIISHCLLLFPSLIIYFLWMRLPTLCWGVCLISPHSTTWLASTILWDNSSMLSGNLICREKFYTFRSFRWERSLQMYNIKDNILTTFKYPVHCYLQRKSLLKFRYFFLYLCHISQLKNLSN